MEKDISAEVKKKAGELGYDLCGVIEAKTFKEYNEYLNKRVDKFPESAHLYKNLFSLATPTETTNWGKSIIVCVRRYNKYKIPQGLDNLFGKLYLFDGRLRYSNEYSNAVLFEQYLNEQGMKTHKDSVPARWAAVKAGLGHFGKNNFIYTKFGSWVYIDTWIVDFEMEYDKENGTQNCPENCRKCIQSCPTILSLEQILTMDEKAFLEVLHPRFWYIGKDQIWLWKCNALRAMANSKNNKYCQFIKDACNDKNDKIKAMALWASAQLQNC